MREQHVEMKSSIKTGRSSAARDRHSPRPFLVRDPLLNYVLNPAPLDEWTRSTAESNSTPKPTIISLLPVRESSLKTVEYALHTAFCIAILAAILLYAPLEPLQRLASVPSLYPIVGVMSCAPTLGQAVSSILVTSWAIFVGVIVSFVATFPLYCTPMGQAVLMFFSLWLFRYWSSHLGSHLLMKYISAVFVPQALLSIQRATDDAVQGHSCTYHDWPELLLVLLTYTVCLTTAFVASFFPYPRLNFRDASQLNRRVQRDATLLVQASLSLLLLTANRPDEDADGDDFFFHSVMFQPSQSENAGSFESSQHRRSSSDVTEPTGEIKPASKPLTAAVSENQLQAAGNANALGRDERSESTEAESGDEAFRVGGQLMRSNTRAGKGSFSRERDFKQVRALSVAIARAEVLHVQTMQHLLVRLDGDLTALGSVAAASVYECAGCCCPAPPGSIHGPGHSKSMLEVARVAYALARSVVGHRDMDTARSSQGRLLRNFGVQTGFLLFQLLRLRRLRQQQATRRHFQLHAYKNGTQTLGLSSEDSSTEDICNDDVETAESAATLLRMQLLRDQARAVEPQIRRLLKFLQEPAVTDRLHHGFLLTEEQSSIVDQTFRDLLLDLSVYHLRKGQRADHTTHHIVGELGVAQMFFAVECFFEHVSSGGHTTAQRQKRPSGCQAFWKSCRKESCGAFGLSSAARKSQICHCRGRNLQFLKQSFSSSLAIYLACMPFLVPILIRLYDFEAYYNATGDSNSTTLSASAQLLQPGGEQYGLLIYNAMWAPFEVIFISDFSVGASFRVSILRFFGTMTGAVFGGVVKVFAGHSPPWLLATLVMWTFFCSLLRTHPRYGYAAQVCAFTASIVVLGDYRSPDLAFGDYSDYAFTLSRMSQGMIGVTIYVLCATLVLPVTARERSWNLLASIFAGLDTHHESVFRLQEAVLSAPTLTQSEAKGWPAESSTGFDEQNSVHADECQIQGGTVQSMLDQRRSHRAEIRQLLLVHESMDHLAQEEFNACSRPSFHSEYLVAIRHSFWRILELHRVIDTALRAVHFRQCPAAVRVSVSALLQSAEPLRVEVRVRLGASAWLTLYCDGQCPASGQCVLENKKKSLFGAMVPCFAAHQIKHLIEGIRESQLEMKNFASTDSQETFRGDLRTMAARSAGGTCAAIVAEELRMQAVRHHLRQLLRFEKDGSEGAQHHKPNRCTGTDLSGCGELTDPEEPPQGVAGTPQDCKPRGRCVAAAGEDGFKHQDEGREETPVASAPEGAGPGSHAIVALEPISAMSQMLPIQVWITALHRYVSVWKNVQDAFDNLRLHLSRRPRFVELQWLRRHTMKSGSSIDRGAYVLGKGSGSGDDRQSDHHRLRYHHQYYTDVRGAAARELPGTGREQDKPVS